MTVLRVVGTDEPPRMLESEPRVDPRKRAIELAISAGDLNLARSLIEEREQYPGDAT